MPPGPTITYTFNSIKIYNYHIISILAYTGVELIQFIKIVKTTLYTSISENFVVCHFKYL